MNKSAQERWIILSSNPLWATYWGVIASQHFYRDDPDMLSHLDGMFSVLHDLAPRLVEGEPLLRLELNTNGHWSVEEAELVGADT